MLLLAECFVDVVDVVDVAECSVDVVDVVDVVDSAACVEVAVAVAVATVAAATLASPFLRPLAAPLDSPMQPPSRSIDTRQAHTDAPTTKSEELNCAHEGALLRSNPSIELPTPRNRKPENTPT